MAVESVVTEKVYNPGSARAPEALTQIYFLNPDDLVVEHWAPGAENGTALLRDVDYLIAGDGRNAAGTIQATGDWPLLDEWRIRRETAAVQPEVLPPHQPLSSKDVERMGDRNALVTQELSREVDRRPAFPRGAEVINFDDLSNLTDGDILEFRYGKIRRLNREPFAGKHYGGDATGRMVPVEGGGADDALRTDLASFVGDALVRYNSEGLYVDGTIGGKLRQMACVLEEFGSTATGISTAAALAASTALREATGRPLYIDKAYALPAAGGQQYDVGNGAVFVGPNGSLAGGIYLGAERKYFDRLPVAYNDGNKHFNYVMARKFNRPVEERERPLDLVSDPFTKLQVLDLSGLEHSRWPSNESDDWTPDDNPEDFTATATSVDYVLDGDNNWHVTWVPVQGGMDVSGFIEGYGGGCMRGVFIRTTKGFEYFYAPDGLPGNFVVKHPGQAPSVSSGVQWLGQGSHDSYEIHNSTIGVRVFNSKQYAIILNGTEIAPARDLTKQAPLIDSGEIVAIGFGIFSAGAANISINNVTPRISREPTGACPVHILAIGNSISDRRTYGCWGPYAIETLDGAMGVKVLGFDNRSKSGDNSYQIAMQLSAGVGNANIAAIVAPEVNDVQQGASWDVTVGNIGAALATLQAANVKTVLMTGYLWYGQDLAAGQGEASSNYEKGAKHRSALRRLAAERGVDFFDLSETSGTVLATYLADPDAADTILRDNIHPSARYYQLLGYWIARALLRALRPGMTRRVIDAPFPAAGYSWMQSGWTDSESAYSLDEDGRLLINGTFLAGDRTNDTTVFTLPPAYRPRGNRFLTVSSGGGKTATLQCQADGQCKIYDLDPAATFIRANGSFFTKLAAI